MEPWEDELLWDDDFSEEEAARTESDFLTVVDEWNKLDRNRERRESCWMR